MTAALEDALGHYDVTLLGDERRSLKKAHELTSDRQLEIDSSVEVAGRGGNRRK